MKQIGLPGVLILVAVSIYWQTLGFEYVWDDSLLLIDRADLLNESLSWALLSQPVLEGTSYLRPLPFLSWYVEFNWLGQNPAISHAVNLILFIANISLVYLVTLKAAGLSGRPCPVLLAFVAGLIYTLHPVLVESTAWVSGRFDLMATTFMLLGTYSVLRWSFRSIIGATVYIVSLAGAVFSKELGLVLPGIVLCLLWWKFNLQPRASGEGGAAFCRYVMPVLMLSVTFYIFYFVVRGVSIGEQYHMPMGMDWLIYSFSNLLPFEALKYYLFKAVLPFGSISLFSPIASLTPFSLSALVLDVVLTLAVLVLGFRVIRRPTISTMLLCSSLLGVVLVLYLVPLGILENIGHERFMALPLAFFVMAVVLVDYKEVGNKLKLSKKFSGVFLPGVFVVWIFGSVVTTFSVVPVWKNELSMWLWAYSAHPEVDVVVNNYISAAMAKGRYELAEEYLNEKLESGEGLSVALQIFYSILLMGAGDAESIKYMEGVIYALPKFHEQENGDYFSRRFLITSNNMAALYLNYATAQMIFNDDLGAAEKYLEISLFYTRPSQQMPCMYFKVALLYAAGKYEESLKLYESLEGKKHFLQRDMSEMVWGILNTYCVNNPKRHDVCVKAKEDGGFASEGG